MIATKPQRFAARCAAASLFALLATGLAAVTFAAGPSFKTAQLLVQPDVLVLNGMQARHGFIVTAVTPDGGTVDVTRRATWSTRQSALLALETNFSCRALADGVAEVVVRFGGRSAIVRVTMTNTSDLRPPSFRQDIEPVLTRAGCNMGACHGKLAGQNGFKLSLRGYAPELDHSWLITDLTSRRINPAFPEESLLVLKALGKVPHEGLQRFPEGSRYHRILTDWIAARAPGPDTNDTDVVRLELLPGNRSLRVGDTQQLLARAHYREGGVRDVTWLAQFFSNDEGTATVTPDGLVKANRHGETAIRAHFQGQVEVVTITIPYENKISPRSLGAAGNAVDGPVFAKLRALRLPPSASCDDATFLRRASLDATGTLPTPAQVREFLAECNAPSAGRNSEATRARWVDKLLASPEFADYWTLQLGDLLQNRKERDHDVRGAKGVRAFHGWLREQVIANRPWDALARDVLTARGSVNDHPEIGWFIYNVGEKQHIEESDTPDAVAQAFLGTRIGCARCHNHPLERYTQDDFYHFAAFFSKVQMKRADADKGGTTLTIGTREEEDQRKRVADAEKGFVDATNAMMNADAGAMESARKKMAEQQKKLDEARREFQKVAARMPSVMQPRTKQSMSAQPLDRQPFEFEPGQDPRERLAAWMTDPRNAHFSGAMVNRLWKHFFGTGLVEPVDDLRASNPPTNPELWRVLNEQFVSHGHDLRHIMRLIMTSRVYQLSAETVPGNQADTKFFSHYYARRLPAEVILDAVSRATGCPDEFKGYPSGTRAVQVPDPAVSSYFLTLFGRSDRVTACACERNGEVTLPQLLHLQNGDTMTKKISAADGRLKSLLKEFPDNNAVMDELFLATLCRPPAPAERKSVQQALSAVQRDESFSDLFWALLNSKEFAFNH
ncbi:MAG: hypothetical protein QOF48_1163 [Verrucomicrobiota bacterium]